MYEPDWWTNPYDWFPEEPDRSEPPCIECGAATPKEAETMCICAGDKDHCHGCELWPELREE